MSTLRNFRLLAALLVSAATHALLLWLANTPGGPAPTYRGGPKLAIELRILPTPQLKPPAPPPPTPTPDARPTAKASEASSRRQASAGFVAPPGFAEPPDLSALETLEQILPGRLVLRIHVSRTGALEKVEIREKLRISSEFLGLAVERISATPLYPARTEAGPLAGFFDVVVGAAPAGETPGSPEPFRPAPAATEN